MHNTLKIHFIKYVAIGVLNTGVGFLIFSILIKYTNADLDISLIGTILISIIFNFLTYGLGFFKAYGIKEFFKFIFAYFIIFFLNRVVLIFLMNKGFDIYISQLINTLYLPVVSYFLFKKYVFSKQI
jgi:putative flippase GtrA